MTANDTAIDISVARVSDPMTALRVQSGETATPGAAPLRRFRFGVAAKLIGTLVVMAAFVVAATILAISLFDTFRDRFQEVAGNDLAIVTIVSRLGNQSQHAVNQAPALAVASTQSSRRLIYSGIEAEIQGLEATVERLGQLGVDAEALNAIGDYQAELTRNIQQLDFLVARRIAGEGRRRELRGDLLQLNGHIADQERAFESELAARVASQLIVLSGGDQAAGQGEMIGTLYSLNEQGERLRSWTSLASQAAALLLAVIAAERSEDVDELEQNFNAVMVGTGRVPEDLSLERINELNDLLDRIWRLANLGSGAFANARARIAVTDRIADTLDRNGIIAERLADTASSLVDMVESELSARSSDIARLADRWIHLYIAGSALCIAGAIAMLGYTVRSVVGRLRGLQASVTAHRHGRPTKIVAKGEDEIADMAKALQFFIDEIGRREAALRASEQRVRSILDASVYPLVITREADSRILFANGRAADLLGLPSTSMVGQLAPDFWVHSEHRDEMIRTLRRRGEAINLEAELQAHHGNRLWALVSAMQMTYDGEPSVIVSFSDITDRKLRELELREIQNRLRRQAKALTRTLRDLEQARLDAEEANRAKSQFLTTMSHELRTPLNAILGFSEIMKDEIFGPIGKPQYSQYAADIHSSGQHLLGLINDILDLSKIEAGKLELEPVWCDLATLLNDLSKLVDVRARRGGVTVSVEVADGMPQLWADERATKQIIFNLLSNALKFTPKDGRVVVSAGCLDDGSILLTVSDTGIGIPDDQLDRVLMPFEQIDNRYSRTGGGTGLGLPLVKSLIELHDGDLRIESKVDVGTTVRVRWPAPPAITTARDALPPIKRRAVVAAAR